MSTKWGVLSAGKISHDFVSAVRTLPSDEHQFVAVAARNLSSAQQFAHLHHIPKAYDSYEKLAKDKDIEVVYIGVIHPMHFSAAKLMLENGKHVLLEKPMTLNLKCTQELISLAKTKNLFLMEALWSRFLPSYVFVMETIKSGTIGDVYHVSANFGMPLTDDRLSKKELGGGTILDIGIYTINIVEMAFDGKTPIQIQAIGHLNDDGVDESISASFLFENGRTASISTNSKLKFPCEAHIAGTKGMIKIPYQFWCADKVILNDIEYEFAFPAAAEPCNFWNTSGLRYEAIEVRKCLNAGKIESEIMSHKDSELLGTITDELRRQVGVEYDVD